MRLFLLAALFVLLSASAAIAAPAFVQSAACNSGVATISFGSAPGNGHVVAGLGAANALTSGSTMTDSNSVSYTQQMFASTSANLSMWDKVVSGSPTATYTYSVTGAAYCQYEMSGIAYPGTYQQNTTTTTTTVVTIAGVKSGDLLLCEVATPGGDTLTADLATSNGTLTIDQGGIGNILEQGHTTATSTASTTCTSTQQNTGGGATVFFIDYTAATVTFPCYPSAGAYPGCMAYDRTLFEQLAGIA